MHQVPINPEFIYKQPYNLIRVSTLLNETHLRTDILKTNDNNL